MRRVHREAVDPAAAAVEGPQDHPGDAVRLLGDEQEAGSVRKRGAQLRLVQHALAGGPPEGGDGGVVGPVELADHGPTPAGAVRRPGGPAACGLAQRPSVDTVTATEPRERRQ